MSTVCDGVLIMEPITTNDVRSREPGFRSGYTNGVDHDSDGTGRIGELFGKLTTDVSQLMTLRIDLLKAELRDGTKTLARDSALMIAGAGLALFAFLAATLALCALVAAWMPFSDFYALAAGSAVVMLVYAIVAGVLVMLGQKDLQKRGLKPVKTVEETEKDKQLVRELRK